MDCGLLQTHHSQRIHHNSSTIPKFPAHVPAHRGRRSVENTKAFFLLCSNRPSRRIWQQILLLSNWQLPIFNTLFVEVHLAFTIYEGRWLSSSSVHWWLWRLRTSLEERRSMPHQRRGRRPSFPQMKPTQQSHCRSFRELAIGCFLIHDNG